jgi:hypothetical protein
MECRPIQQNGTAQLDRPRVLAMQIPRPEYGTGRRVVGRGQAWLRSEAEQGTFFHLRLLCPI